jgi:glutathione S-transferase
MRLSDPASVLTLTLYALPVVVAWLRLSVGAALFVTVVVAIVGIFVRSRSILEPADPDLVELHSITYSHYVEKVRWCLDATGIAYREVASIGIVGLLLTGRTVPLLVVPSSRVEIGDSPKILRYVWGAYSAVLPRERIGFLEATPEMLALEKRFDDELGIPIRLWSYWHLLKQRDLTQRMWGIDEPGIPLWQRRLLPWMDPLLARLLKPLLGVTDASAEASRQKVRTIFAEVDAMLADGRRYLMGGSEKTFVDITFASLAALALFPDGYAGAKAVHNRVPLDLLSPAWREEVEYLRSTKAGQFALRLYAEERNS